MSVLQKKAYKAIRNSVYDSTGKQLCVILPCNCSKKRAAEIAKMVAAQFAESKERE